MSDAPVVHLRELPCFDPAGDLVDQAKRLLEKCESGEVSSFAAAIVYKDGCVGHVRSSAPSFPSQIGSLTRLVHKMNLDLDRG